MIKQLNKQKYKGKSVSIFIEDSIFLAGRPDFIKQFVQECKANSLRIKFGCQFTIDTFLSLEDWIIEDLSSIGLDYVAFGIETSKDSIAKTFSKNTNRKENWDKKTELIVNKCKKHNLKCGMFLIWGLGESQNDRVNHILQIYSWIINFQIPIDVGLNIATQHPLQIINENYLKRFNYKKYNYIDWGTKKESKYLSYFIKLFGEASEEYSIDMLPTIEEIKELDHIYKKTKDKTYSMV